MNKIYLIFSIRGYLTVLHRLYKLWLHQEFK